MRLLIVTQYFWPENFRINDLAIDLVQRGHDVTVLTGYPNYPQGNVFDEFVVSPESYSKHQGINIVRVPICPRRRGNFRLLLNYISFVLNASILGFWKIRHKNFDAIFVYEPSPITVGIPALVIKYFKKRPVVFWVLDLWPNSLKAIGVVKSNLMLRLIGFIVSFIYKRCDLILAQSKSFVSEIEKYCPLEKPIEYFPGWPDFLFEKQSKEKAPEIIEDASFFNIIFTGNIGEAQDFQSILLAANLLKTNKRIRWFILGDGRRCEWVKDQIKFLGLEKAFFMMGNYPIERMPSFFAHADALLVTLKNDPIFSMTIPAKVQTYLASGKPILAMLNGEGAQVLKDSGAALVVPSGDYISLVKAIVRMSDMDLNSRNLMGRRGTLFCKREFNKTLLMSKLECWLNNIRIQNELH